MQVIIEGTLQSPGRTDRRGTTLRSPTRSKKNAPLMNEWGAGRMRWSWATWALLVAWGGGLPACSSDERATGGGGTLAGQVIISGPSGPLRGAMVSVDQLDYAVTTSAAVRNHVGDTMTDPETGRFGPIDTTIYSGVLLITARGGSFVDSGGAAIALDPNDGIETMIPFELGEAVDDALVSPVGALIAARMRWAMSQHSTDIITAEHDAEMVLDKHFGNVTWPRVKLASLDIPASSPTEPVRAALIETALGYLAHDIGQAAAASPQDVNVLRLTQQLAMDVLKDGGFDGNDGNDPSPGSGLQVGVCAPVGCTTADSPDICAREGCRTKCDLYAGTPRALLAGEVTKVIRDPTVNKTGLVTGDVLAVARAIADSTDVALFPGQSCTETLDRTPPTLMFSAKPADGDFVHGTVMLSATAIDDFDLPPAPPVHIAGFMDADGDPNNNVATIVLDTAMATSGHDGPLTVMVTTADAAGNTAAAMRMLQVDNTPPVVTLDSTGFLVDGATWWASTATSTLTGTLVEQHPIGVEAVIGDNHIPGTITGSTWSIPMVGGSPDGSDIRVVVTDAAGNQGSVSQRIRFDADAPALSFPSGASQVFDESSDTITYTSTPSSPSTDEIPIHNHTSAPAPPVDLGLGSGTSCQSITKFTYLLDQNPPLFGTENARNPLHYVLAASDTGIGVDPVASTYRVGRDDGTGNILWLTSSSQMPPASVSGSTITFNVPVYAHAATGINVVGLDSVEGSYHVEFVVTDKLGHATTLSRCFNLHLRAPPLHFGGFTVGAKTYAPGDAQNHKFALKTLHLEQGAPADQIQIAQHVLVPAAAASMLDMPLTNGTASFVYLTVKVTRPSKVTARQTFSRRYVTTISTVNVDCSQDSRDPDCSSVPVHPPIDDGGSPAPSQPPADVTGLLYPVRVYQLDTSGVPTTQIGCIGSCLDTDTTFVFQIPPRPAGSAPLRFLVMSMVGQIAALQPIDSTHGADGAFSDFTINGVHVSGINGAFISGCSSFDRFLHCRQETDYHAYRALTSITLSLSGSILTNTYGTSITTAPTSSTDGGTGRTSPDYAWSTSMNASQLPGP